MDKALENAIHIAVENEGQPPQVAKRLVAWFKELSIDPNMDDERTASYLKNVLDQLVITDDG